MPSDLPLTLQTVYAELLERARADAFSAAFPSGGSFVAKTQRGRRYWYFQQPSAAGRGQLYAGPESPELLARIIAHRQASERQRDRRGLIAMLVRAGNLPRPIPMIGSVVAAIEQAGVFRLRGVLIGTVAYQTYAAMLGSRLPAALLQTNDVDVAQFADVSVAVADIAQPILETLRKTDASFSPVPHIVPNRVVSLMASSGVRVDFLTPNRGRDTEQPVPLPAFGMDAQPLRFLDFLIRDPEQAVLLHGAGILVSVPSPARFALHKLIISRRRRLGDAKRQKDVLQAQSLLCVLTARKDPELRSVWREAFARGKVWQRLLTEGLADVEPGIRQATAHAVNAPPVSS